MTGNPGFDPDCSNPPQEGGGCHKEGLSLSPREWLGPLRKIPPCTSAEGGAEGYHMSRKGCLHKGGGCSPDPRVPYMERKGSQTGCVGGMGCTGVGMRQRHGKYRPSPHLLSGLSFRTPGVCAQLDLISKDMSRKCLVWCALNGRSFGTRRLRLLLEFARSLDPPRSSESRRRAVSDRPRRPEAPS